MPEREVIHHYHEPSGAIVAAIRIVELIRDIVIVLLVFRFIFRLLGANPLNSVVDFLYDITRPLVAPFFTIFPVIVEQGRVLEWASLVAIIVYALLAYILVRIVVALER